MTALPLEPHTEAEEATLKRIEGAEPAEESAVEKVARALYDRNNGIKHITWEATHEAVREHMRRLAAAAIEAMKSTSPASCGDLSPSINFGGDSDAERLMCDLPVDHGGSHQHDNGDGFPPVRWVAIRPSPAEEALARVEALAERLGDESREFYYDNRHTHENGISYVSGMSDAMEQIADRITAALAVPVAQAGEGR